MARIVEKDVLWFQVAEAESIVWLGGTRVDEPIHNIQFVQVFESKKQLGTIEARTFLVETLFTLQVVEQLSAVDKAVPCTQ